MITTADLKVGDKVGICSGGWETRCELRTVKRRTATQIILDDDTRWTKYGKKVGESSSYHGSWMVSEADAHERIAEQKARHERFSLLREIRDANYKDMPTTALREIADAVKRHQPKP